MVSSVRSTLIGLSLMGISALTALMSACSAPDPAALTVRDPIAQNTSSGSNSSASSASSGGGGDGGAASGFFTRAFAAGNPGQETAAVPGHAGSSNAGADCSACHKAGGTAANKIFKAAGTVYDGANAAKNAEVLIKGATAAQECSVYTDSSGNFWCEVDFGANAQVAVRTSATRESKMLTAMPNGNCSTTNCHTATNKVDFQ